MDVIDKVGPGGDFLTQKHTLKHFREMRQPQLMSRQRLDDWERGAKKRMGDRLRDKTIALMDEHQPEPLPAAMKREIEFVLKNGRAPA